MKNNFRWAAFVLAAASPAAAQQGNSAALIASEKQAMAAFAWMDGEWRGEGVTQTPTGEHRVTHTERSGPLLDGSIRLVEGHSYRADGSTGFNALAMISYDPATRQFHMASHAEGRGGDFLITPSGTGYVWQIAAGPMTIRYTAAFKDGVWTENGERVVPGQPAIPFFHMALRRIGDSPWPGGGAVMPR